VASGIAATLKTNMRPDFYFAHVEFVKDSFEVVDEYEECGLSPGAIVAIVLGSLAFAVLVALFTFRFCRKQGKCGGAADGKCMTCYSAASAEPTLPSAAGQKPSSMCGCLSRLCCCCGGGGGGKSAGKASQPGRRESEEYQSGSPASNVELGSAARNPLDASRAPDNRRDSFVLAKGKGDAAGAGAEAPLPAGWEQHYDESTERLYFHNTVTGLTAWTRPT
jgi:hypothetical protein